MVGRQLLGIGLPARQNGRCRWLLARGVSLFPCAVAAEKQTK
jgi:hypothetical protein